MRTSLPPDHSKWLVLLILAVLFASCATVRLPSIEIKKLNAEKKFEWKDAVKLAFENNPDLIAARAAVKSASLNRNIAAGDYLPSVNGIASKGRVDSATAAPHDTLSVGITAQQNLFSGFETTGNVLFAQKNLEAQKFAYQQSSADVRSRLRNSYVELLRLQRLLDVNQRIAERKKQNAELIKLRYEAGREHLGSSMRADAILEQALFNIRQTERQIESEYLRFGREIGGDFTVPLHVQGQLEQMIPIAATGQPDYIDLAEHAPPVAQLLKAAEAAKANVITAQSAVWPAVDGSYEHNYAGDRAADLERETFLGLNINVPFFNGGKNVQAILKAKADYDTARETARSLRDETVAQLSETWVAFLNAVERVHVQQSFLEASRKRSEIVRAQYSSGLSNFQEFDSAEQDLSNAEISYVESLAGALTAEAAWEFKKGSTLEDALREA